MHEACPVPPTDTSSKGDLQAASRGVPLPRPTPSISSSGGDAHLSSEEEGSSGTDAHGQTPYLCNDSSCSSQENTAIRPTELELAAARDLINENLSRSQAVE